MKLCPHFWFHLSYSFIRSRSDCLRLKRLCVFGARMLGEVAKTIHEMITSKKKPILIYSGLANSLLGLLLQKFVANKWCRKIILPSEYARQKNPREDAIVVGPFSERNAEAI